MMQPESSSPGPGGDDPPPGGGNLPVPLTRLIGRERER